jgi:hypothetical protein
MKVAFITLFCLFCALVVSAQEPSAQQPAGGPPIYKVTVVHGTATAVNYAYRSDPTMIDFRGTVLLPHASGQATVESRKGSTVIDADVRGLLAPQRFGREYLTYVLWAITPEGRPQNLGELVPGPSDKASIRVSTDLQAFAMLVTAEPYAAVRQPGNVVVLENQVRPDTVGIIEQVQAKYDLLPRGQYTYQVPDDGTPAANEPKVSMHDYEALSALYQARYAMSVAENANAAELAPDTYERARVSLTNAQQLQDSKGDYRRVVQLAHEAAQTAQDALTIAQKRRQEREQAEKDRAAALTAAKLQAEASEAQRSQQIALAQADSSRAQAQAAEAARRNAESQAAAAESRAAAAAAAEAQAEARVNNAVVEQERNLMAESRRHELRAALLQQMQAALPSLDTGRGLVATVGESEFRGAEVRDEPSSSKIARIAAVVAAHPELHVSVEGYSGNAATASLASERADAVRRLLVANGARSVSAAGLADSRPVGPSARENSRVEIVITGDSIGNLPGWETPYSLFSSVSGKQQ